MINLPTREKASYEHFGRDSRTDDEVKNLELLREKICVSYMDGDLQTRDELINNIDMESCAQAFKEIAPAWYAVMPYETVEVLMHGILDAALKEESV